MYAEDLLEFLDFYMAYVGFNVAGHIDGWQHYCERRFNVGDVHTIYTISDDYSESKLKRFAKSLEEKYKIKTTTRVEKRDNGDYYYITYNSIKNDKTSEESN